MIFSSGRNSRGTRPLEISAQTLPRAHALGVTVVSPFCLLGLRVQKSHKRARARSEAGLAVGRRGRPRMMTPRSLLTADASRLSAPDTASGLAHPNRFSHIHLLVPAVCPPHPHKTTKSHRISRNPRIFTASITHLRRDNAAGDR